MASQEHNLGFLITIFKAPPSCSFYGPNNAVTNTEWQPTQTSSNNKITDDLSCCPTATKLPGKKKPGDFDLHFRGLICPIECYTIYGVTTSVDRSSIVAINTGFGPNFIPMNRETIIGRYLMEPICINANDQRSQICSNTIATDKATNVGPCMSSDRYTIFSTNEREYSSIMNGFLAVVSISSSTNPSRCIASNLSYISTTLSNLVKPANTVVTVSSSPSDMSPTFLEPLAQLFCQISDPIHSDNTTSSIPPQSISEPTSLNTTVGIAIAISIPLTVLLVVSLTIHFFLHKQRQKHYYNTKKTSTRPQKARKRREHELATLTPQAELPADGFPRGVELDSAVSA